MSPKDQRILTKIGPHFILRTPEYNARFLNELKDAIPWNERYWLAQERYWIVAARHLETVATLSEELWPELAEELRTGNNTAKAREAARAEIATIVASRASDTDLDLEGMVPEGLTPYPFQKAGIKWLVGHRDAIVGDEMGCGKTIQAIIAANVSKPQRVLIVCPASLRGNWRREWNHWSTLGLPVYIVKGTSKFVAVPKRKNDVLNPRTAAEGVWIVNHDILSKMLGATKTGLDTAPLAKTYWNLLIVDEFQYVKNPTAQRSKALFGWWDKREKAWLGGIKSDRRVFLSGTPFVNRPIELWPTLHYLDPEGLGRNWKSYTRQYCGGHNEIVPTPQGCRSVWVAKGATNTSELNRELRLRLMIRREKSQVLTELPPKTITPVELEPNGSTKAVKAELERVREALKIHTNEQLAKSLASMSRSDIGVLFDTMSAERQEVALSKVNDALPYVQSIVEADEKVIVFVHHRAVRAALEAGLDTTGISHVAITGETPTDARQGIVDAFQTDPTVKVFIGQWTAAGVGLTLTAAQHVVALELPWTPGDFQQGCDRAHRIGQLGNVQVHVLYYQNSLDAYMAKILVEKARTLHEVLDAELQTPTVTPVSAKTRPKPSATPPKLSKDQMEAIHTGLRSLAAVCDGAVTEDGCGFNGVDTGFGRKLAAQSSLTERQALAARKMLRKYAKQLGTDLLSAMGS